MKVCCVSDFHGFLPDIPECELLLIAGDLVPVTMHGTALSRVWLEGPFRRWLASLPASVRVVGIAGNHDFIFQERPDQVPALSWTYLQDSGTEYRGFRLWGTPWQPYFYDWAFNLYEKDLVEKWRLIPDDTDILLVHGPPHGYGDVSPYSQAHTGSPGLLSRIQDIQPRLVVSGHIHSGYGQYQIGPTVFVNASYVDEEYKPTHRPIVVDL